jgi:hypothetical protein
MLQRLHLARGQTEKIGNFVVYVAEPTTGEAGKDVAVIYACGAFGLGLINNKTIPDRMANALGCMVYILDLLEGWFLSLCEFTWIRVSL